MSSPSDPPSTFFSCMRPYRPTLKLQLGASLVLFLIIFFVVSSLIYGLHPYETSLQNKNTCPSLSHLFGTDELGRDLLSRATQGICISCGIGAIAFMIDMTVGVLWGVLIAITAPSPISEAMRKISEVLYSLPYLLVVILISVFTGTGIIPLVVAMLCMGWVQTARMVEMLTVEALHSEYVLASKVIGVSTQRIIFRHILPNTIGPILASAILSVPHAIFSEAFLSFLGVGIQPPQASLGSLISDALPALRFYPWRILFPSGVITLLILSLTLISDGIMEMTDPKLSRQIDR